MNTKVRNELVWIWSIDFFPTAARNGRGWCIPTKTAFSLPDSMIRWCHPYLWLEMICYLYALTVEIRFFELCRVWECGRCLLGNRDGKQLRTFAISDMQFRTWLWKGKIGISLLVLYYIMITHSLVRLPWFLIPSTWASPRHRRRIVCAMLSA